MSIFGNTSSYRFIFTTKSNTCIVLISYIVSYWIKGGVTLEAGRKNEYNKLICLCHNTISDRKKNWTAQFVTKVQHKRVCLLSREWPSQGISFFFFIYIFLYIYILRGKALSLSFPCLPWKPQSESWLFLLYCSSAVKPYHGSLFGHPPFKL